MYNIKLGAIA